MDGKRQLAVGIIGLGHLHPRLYMPLFRQAGATEVVAAMDPDTSLCDSFCADFGVQGYATVEELLGQHELDIAAIFLPHADCPAAAEKCAAAGAHIMVEKPMAADVAGAQRLVRATEAHGVKVTTGYCWRLHPVAKEFRRLVQSGVIGTVVGAGGRCAAGRLQRYIDGHASWMLERERSGGGPMVNLGVHWIDLFRWILEDEVAEVSGQNVKVNQTYDIEDNSFAHVRFSGGALVSLDISYTVPDSYPYGRDLYLAVRGTTGAISWAPAYEGENDVLAVCSDHPDFEGAPRRELTFEIEPAEGYSGIMGLEYVRDFAEAIIVDREPKISGADGVAAMRVVEAIYRSAREKRWITIVS